MMLHHGLARFATILLLTWLAGPGSGRALAQGNGLRGDLGSHDPATIIKCKDRYYSFATGQGITSKSSADKVFWTAGPAVFAQAPAWTTNAVPGFTGNFWAPDIFFLNGRYCLYYAISTWGSQVSAIGLVTNPTLDPTDPAYQWTDQGVVIASGVGSAYNTIDPSVALDAAGNPWMAFGSYWNGIYLVQLNALTGLRLAPNSPTYRLAGRNNPNDISIEAACLHRHGSYYYLFVNWGSCCTGVNSTYHVRVGRSASVTGPYLDRNGVDLRNGGGSLFLEATGKFTGPGHVGILNDDGQDWFSYHYYDAGAYAPWYGAYGAANFDLQPLTWTAEGWPAFTNDWCASYAFETDARDEGGQYYGLLQGGASITNDPLCGRVLNLSGTNQWVQLPPGVAYARTFVAVVKWNGGPAWQRIFDFGNDTASYCMLTPSSGDGKLRCDLRANGITQTLQAPFALPAGIWYQVAVTTDGQRGVLYLNGVPVGTNAAMSLSPPETRAQTNHLGRSKFSADPDFRGQIASFRAHGRVLSAAELARPQVVINEPLAGEGYAPGATVRFSGSAADLFDTAIPDARLTWLVQWIQAGSTSNIAGPLVGVANGSFQIPASGAQATNGYHRLQLTATDASGRSGTRKVDIHPSTSNGAGEPWTSFYPFTVSAQDASNRYSGTLKNGASIANDATRGKVLNLAGGSQHVSLPTGAATARTIAGWVKWSGTAAWQRVFDFGSGTGRWLFLTPKNSDGRLQCAVTADGGSYVRVMETTNTLPPGVWTHVAVVLDGRQGVLYLNGQPVAVNNSVNLLPADIVATNVWLGRSQFSADAYFTGQLDGFRLHSRPLAPAELFARSPLIVLPSSNLLFTGGSTLPFHGAAVDYADGPVPASAFAWSADWLVAGTSHELLAPLAGITNGFLSVPATAPLTTNLACRVNLTVTDLFGIPRSTSVTLGPRLSWLSLATVPEGLQLTLDGDVVNPPVSLPLVAGMTRTLGAASSQMLGGSNLDFTLWSDGGAATHSIMVPGTNALFTAAYLAPSVTLRAEGSGVTLSWPAWAAPLALFATTNLASPVFWEQVVTPPSLEGGAFHVSLPGDGPAARYFRLAPP